MKSLSPTEVAKRAQTEIPDYIIEAVNNLLTQKFRGRRAILLQKDVIKEIRRINPEVNMDKVFDNGWMDFEPSFRKAGWKVEYDKPAYCESYEAFYEFSK